MNRTSQVGWRCPECGRVFRRRTREHSCDLRDVGAHLAKASPEVAATFEAVRAVLDRQGPQRVVALETMLVFSAGASSRGMVVRRHHLDLGFFLDRLLVHPRVSRSERLSPTRSAHHVRLSRADDVDGEVEAGLREAYGLGRAPTRAR
ncbi:hypothetical protein FBQ97_05085 [Acidobacteria bacterium ACD]|nr:hypothetical protein [Acidobacteria bacterium ACD]